MQGYDLIMLIVLGMATIFGAIKGFAWQVASLASIVVSYFVAYHFRYDVAEMIQAKPPWNQFLAMLILYVGTSFVIWVGFRLISGTIDRVRLKEFDRHLGAAFGLAKGLVYCLLITMFATSLLGPKQQAAICQSRSGYYIAQALDNGVGILPKEIHDVVGPYLARLDDKLKSGGAYEAHPAGDAGSQDGLWPTGGIPGLNNIPDALQTGIRNALPQMLPGSNATGNNGFGPSTPNDWNTTLPDSSGSGLPSNGLSGGGLPGFDSANFNANNFDSSNFDPASIFPPGGGMGAQTAPQIYPPLQQNSGAPPPSSAVRPLPPITSGLRPVYSGDQTAQPGWGNVVPR